MRASMMHAEIRYPISQCLHSLGMLRNVLEERTLFESDTLGLVEAFEVPGDYLAGDASHWIGRVLFDVEAAAVQQFLDMPVD
jgi:hypothetical protein